MSETYDEGGSERDGPALHAEVSPAGPPPETGHPRIDDALERLEGLDELDISAHPEVFDTIHGVLRESLANAGRDEGTPDIA